MTPTRVETRLKVREIMETNTSKPWDTSWYSDKGNKNFPRNQEMAFKPCTLLDVIYL